MHRLLPYEASPDGPVFLLVFFLAKNPGLWHNGQERKVQPVTSLTKRAIRASFLKLLNERPLNKITVKDIVEDCGINRN